MLAVSEGGDGLYAFERVGLRMEVLQLAEEVKVVEGLDVVLGDTQELQLGQFLERKQVPSDSERVGYLMLLLDRFRMIRDAHSPSGSMLVRPWLLRSSTKMISAENLLETVLRSALGIGGRDDT